MTQDQLFMMRALQLARWGEGHTSPNPMVGAVLAHGSRIIGEGYHARVGEAHAEVKAIASVDEADRSLIPESTLYVTLEPCCIHGRTPPCTDLILRERIPRVVVGASDHTPGVYGQSLDLLRRHGVEVLSDVCAEAAAWLARPRTVFVTQQRPFITLKWALSQDGFIGKDGQQVKLSNALAMRWVHRLRYRCDALMIGSGTVLSDNPYLTNRYYGEKHPVRIILDRRGRLRSLPLRMWETAGETLVFVREEHADGYPGHITVLPLADGGDHLLDVLSRLHARGVAHLLVEGGAALLETFLREELWDEAFVSVSPVFLGEGVRGPSGLSQRPDESFRIGSDGYHWFRRVEN
jgi:diaminohydroxyphosphoribosylaminopyrimidine deaminase/5-amino-6-(5-phosphoribosylamino)uracil reductase